MDPVCPKCSGKMTVLFTGRKYFCICLRTSTPITSVGALRAPLSGGSHLSQTELGEEWEQFVARFLKA